MKTQAISRALKKWSPKGLCTGRLIKKNGDPETSLGCAVGCLVMETLHTDKKFSSEFTASWASIIVRDGDTALCSLPECIGDAVVKKYNISRLEEEAIEIFNDRCLRTRKYDKTIPAILCKTIRQLRLKNRRLNSAKRKKAIR